MARIAVVGAGAIGQFYAAQFILAGHDVRLVARRDLGLLRERGMHVFQEPTESIASSLTRRELRLRPTEFRTCADGQQANVGGVDWCLLAMKTTNLAAAPALCRPLIEAGAGLVVLMNGLGVEDLCAAWCPPERIWGMLCFICVNRDEDGTIRHLAHGQVGVGHFLDQVNAQERLGQLVDSAGISRITPPCLLEARWRKLAWNIPFNGLSVAGGGRGRTTKQILDNPDIRQRCEQIVRETIRIGNADLAQHGRTERIDEDEWTLEQIRRTDEMGDYQTSTLLDWRARLPLEIDAMFHEPLRRAHRLGVTVPALERMVAELPAT
ncbi:MAG: 2-dehydropantoate 2-reductase [Planctomycetota bacterium]